MGGSVHIGSIVLLVLIWVQTVFRDEQQMTCKEFTFLQFPFYASIIVEIDPWHEISNNVAF